jgi:NAD(P)H-dependent FMN reductase
MTRIAVIIGSTRDSRFGEKPARWILEQAKKRTDFETELVDIKDFNLPFFNEVASNRWVPTQDANALKWQRKLAEFDGYIIVTSEYNRSIPASLKNAIDQAYVEWIHKPLAVVAYGSTGGARAAEHLRMISVELQMVPVRSGVHIGGGEFMKVHPMGANGPMSEIEAAVLPSVTAMLDDLSWWADVTAEARKEEAEKAA